MSRTRSFRCGGDFESRSFIVCKKTGSYYSMNPAFGSFCKSIMMCSKFHSKELCREYEDYPYKVLLDYGLTMKAHHMTTAG